MAADSGVITVKYGNAQFRIDVPIITRIVHSMYINLYANSNCGETPIGESSALGLYKVRMTTLDVDWAAARRWADAQTADYMRNFLADVHRNPAPWGPSLSALVDLSAQQKEQFFDQMGAVQSKNMEALQTIAKVNDAGMMALKGVQVGSAVTLQVGATVLTGGAAMAAIGGGAALKVATSYSETGKVTGTAVFDAGSEAVWNIFKVGKEFKGAEEIAVVLVEAGWQAGMELLQGKTGSEVMSHAALKLSDPVVGKVMKMIPATTLKKWAYPILKKFQDAEHPVKLAMDTVNEFKKTLTTTTLVKGTDALREHLAEMGKEQEGTAGHGAVVKHSTITDKTVLYKAFYNVAKGPGKGW